MVIYPACLSKEDPEWMRACALMKMLALDPRMPPSGRRGENRGFYQCADDYLIRPRQFMNGKWVDAKFYSFSVRFAVSASIHGSIDIDDDTSLAEFRRAVGSAIEGPLTAAERERHVLSGERLALDRAGTEAPEGLAARVRAASHAAMDSYEQMRKSLEDDRRHRGCGMPSLTTHQEILEGLISQALTSQAMVVQA